MHKHTCTNVDDTEITFQEVLVIAIKENTELKSNFDKGETQKRSSAIQNCKIRCLFYSMISLPHLSKEFHHC